MGLTEYLEKYDEVQYNKKLHTFEGMENFLIYKTR